MSTLPAAFGEAFRMLATLDADLLAIVWLSLQVSVTAVLVSALVALPFGAALAVARFPGRQASRVCREHQIIGQAWHIAAM